MFKLQTCRSKRIFKPRKESNDIQEKHTLAIRTSPFRVSGTTLFPSKNILPARNSSIISCQMPIGISSKEKQRDQTIENREREKINNTDTLTLPSQISPTNLVHDWISVWQTQTYVWVNPSREMNWLKHTFESFQTQIRTHY